MSGVGSLGLVNDRWMAGFTSLNVETSVSDPFHFDTDPRKIHGKTEGSGSDLK